MSKKLWTRVVLPFVVGCLIGEGIINSIKWYTANTIPETNKVRQGYVVPNKLEVDVEDVDKNGEKETILRYDGRNYLLKLDEQGRPTIQAYEVKPAEIVTSQPARR